jgi:hypothetical protein
MGRQQRVRRSSDALATVLRRELAVQKLAKGPKLYLTTTHFHPEYASGDSAFPPGAILIRPAMQQEEMEARGSAFLELFRGRSAQFKELLQDVKLRKADLIFDSSFFAQSNHRVDP